MRIFIKSNLIYFDLDKFDLWIIMHLSQLAAFREVMTAGSLSQAARNLNRTQPAVSLAIKSLEDNLGLKLFRREGRRLIPVPEAYYLLSESEVLLTRLDALNGTMKSLATAHSGHLRIAAMPGPSAYLMPAFLSQEIGANTDIHLALSSRNTLQIRKLVGSQSLDFGFGDGGIDEEKDHQLYRTERISARCFCALSCDHPLAQKTEISIADLDQQKMGLLPDGHLLNKTLEHSFAAAGCTFNIAVECQFFLPLMHFVAAGQCIAVIDPLAVATERAMQSTQQKIFFRPLSDDITYEYAIYTPRHRPLSKLAERIRDGWRSEVISILNSLGAEPVLDGEK